MSDQSPPPKPKPGSLRDRIAAFENKGSSAPSQGPPMPRPKPGGLQWKPKPPSPPTSPDFVQSPERKSPSAGGMSASDAMESIGRGGSLKERMAALQGKGGFGGASPPVAPKPNVDKPKWKPPPAVPASGDEPTEAEDSARDASRSPPPRAAVSPPPDIQGTSKLEEDAAAQDADRGDIDPEEEERQRRAAIAARMARLGGARFGMAPPVVAPKPFVRKSEPTLEVKEDAPIDQPIVLRESGQVLVTSHPRDEASSVTDPVAETERKDDADLVPLPVPTHAPVSMPLPAAPRRAAPPRKKPSKNAPTIALPSPPLEAPAPTTDKQPPTSLDQMTQDSQEITNVTQIDDNLNEPASVEAFHELVKESEKQETKVEFIESAGSHDAQQVQPSETVDAEEDEEVRRHRVAVKLAQMGAVNPLAGLVPQRPSFDEPAPELDEEPNVVEDHVHEDTEELRETIPLPAVEPRPAQSIEVDFPKLHLETDQDDGKQVPDDRDGERASYTEAQSDRFSPEGTEEPISIVHSTEQEQGTVSTTQQASAFKASGPGTEQCEYRRQDSKATADIENDTSKNETEENEIPPPRLPPPPVNLRSKPTPPSSPSLSPPPKTPIQALKVDEEERPASPDVPPRPVPPPGRSGSLTEDVLSPPPRRSMPPRRTSVRVMEALMDTPSSPPPVPTSSRPVNRRPATPPIITTLVIPDQAAPEAKENENEEDTSENVTPQPEGQEDEASVRRRAIAERMARLGAVRFGAPPPMNPLSRPPLPAAPPPTSIPPDETELEDKEEVGALTEEEDEGARKQRITAKLAGMGGMRLGMMPPGPSVPARRVTVMPEDGESESEDAVPPVPVPAPLQRPPPTRKPPPPIEMPVEQGSESRRTSYDVVRVEAEESDIEEVRYSDAEAPMASEEANAPRQPFSAEVLPTPPRVTSRSPPPGRPPIQTIPTTLGRLPSASAEEEESSPGETPTVTAIRAQSEYVMVEAEYPYDEGFAPPPHRRSTRGESRSSIPLPPPPPPSAIDPPDMLTSSAQWELPTIPQGVEVGEGSEMADSEDSTAVDPLTSSGPSSRRASGKAASLSGSTRRSVDQQQRELTADELMTVWGKVGVQVLEAATTLFERSKRALVGDGSYAGFVRAVLAQVPGASGGDENEWGYVVYAQAGNAVQRRVSDILPGDIIGFWDAKLKGHKGLHAYTQSPGGTGSGVLMGIVSDFDAKKSKVRVWQANQHVGQQTVENVSYRLEDLKSGQVKVFRVLEA